MGRAVLYSKRVPNQGRVGNFRLRVNTLRLAKNMGSLVFLFLLRPFLLSSFPSPFPLFFSSLLLLLVPSQPVRHQSVGLPPP